MDLFHTKSFGGSNVDKEIDEWLKSFHRPKPRGEYNFDIVGYVAIDNRIVITVHTFEAKQ